MNGRKTKISQTLAEKIARRLEDSEIQTILKFQPYDQTSVDYEIFGMVWPALSTETKKKIIALLRKEGVNETIIHKLEGTITINQA